MGNSKITFIIFGFWLGLLLAGSVVIELFLQGQVYSYRTFMLVLILFITGIFSSALSWLFFSRHGRSIYSKSMILSLANIVLFSVIGVIVSYITIVVLPDLLEPGIEPGHDSILDILMGIVLGTLGTAFSFKTFGLPLLWPFGVISGFIGTFIFVYVVKVKNSRARH